MANKQINHILVPKHEKISDKDKEKLLEQYNISLKQLPKISKKDPAIQHIDTKAGDIIKITRDSPTAGKAIFYRVVTDV
ncbi:MAG: DNA-directed RNA polymerase subunit H [Candidatus Woesearchaeota archaeon]